jgi:hypothetical protein
MARARVVASLVPSLTLLVALVAGCASAHVTGARPIGTPSPAKPAIVYVADFELDVRHVRAERGVPSTAAATAGAWRRPSEAPGHA